MERPAEDGGVAVRVSQVDITWLPIRPEQWVFCFPLAREAKPFQRRCPKARVAILGVGYESARRTARKIIDRYSPLGLVVAGYAGALRSGLVVGDVLVPSHLNFGDGRVWLLYTPAPLIDERSYTLLSWPQLIATPDEKRRIGQRFEADIVDMETAAVQEECVGRGVACTAVRAISDAVDDSLSPDLVKLIAGGRVRLRSVLAALARSPKLLPELLRLHWATTRAGNALATVLSRLASAP